MLAFAEDVFATLIAMTILSYVFGGSPRILWLAIFIVIIARLAGF